MRIFVIMYVSFYVYVCSELALLYNTWYKVIAVGEILLCADTAIGLALEKTPRESDWPITTPLNQYTQLTNVLVYSLYIPYVFPVYTNNGVYSPT